MVNYLGEYTLEYKYEAANVFKGCPENWNFCSASRVQVAMVEVVEFKSNNLALNSFSTTKFGGEISQAFSHTCFTVGLGLINIFCVKYIGFLFLFLLEHIYLREFHSSHDMNW